MAQYGKAVCSPNSHSAAFLLTTGVYIGVAGKSLQSKARAHILESMLFYTAAPFIKAIGEKHLIQKIKSYQPNYASLQTQETGIENYVIILSESARISNMHLYGFALNATPNADTISTESLVFTKAVAPAPIRLLAVPMALSRAKPDSFTPEAVADNIIMAANQASYQTIWLNAQGHSGESYVFAIGSAQPKRTLVIHSLRRRSSLLITGVNLLF